MIVKKLTINGQTLWQMHKLESITIKSFLGKKVYTFNESIDTSGLIVEAHYDDGTSAELSTSSYTYAPLTATSTSGESLTVTYKENDVEKTVESSEKIIVKALKNIELKGTLATTVYNYGDKISIEGLSLKLNYNDGTTEAKISGFDWLPKEAKMIGSNTLIVSFGEQSVALANAFIVNRVLDRIEVSHTPDKLLYLPNEVCNKAGLSLNAYFSDSSTPTTIDSNNADWGKVTISDNVLSTADTTATISYTYNGLTKTVDIDIAVMTGIKVSSLPNKTRYRSGQYFSIAGMVVKGVYNDGSEIELTSEKYTISISDGTLLESAIKPNEIISEDVITCTVTCNNTDYSEMFDVTVDAVKDIYALNPTKTKYRVGERFDPTGMVVRATWTDGSKSEITNYTYSKTELTATDTSIVIRFESKGKTLFSIIKITMYRILTLNLINNGYSVSDNYPAGDLRPSVSDVHLKVSGSKYGTTTNYYDETIAVFENSTIIAFEISAGSDKILTITPIMYEYVVGYCGLTIKGLIDDDGSEVSMYPYLSNKESTVFKLTNTADDISLEIQFMAYDYRYLHIRGYNSNGNKYLTIKNNNYVAVKAYYYNNTVWDGEADNWSAPSNVMVNSVDLSVGSSKTVTIASNNILGGMGASYLVDFGSNTRRFITGTTIDTTRQNTKYI